ncbi:MAG TPA: hypothetical protein VNI52_13005 [Sphingobacteriaceae bacterium]|nr:hypothetical protein [Sphingobacteriaceae bacterium]
MNNLKPLVFVVPVVAFIVVVVSYFLLRTRASDKTCFKHFTFLVLVLGFLSNFIWEVFQMPLYKIGTPNLKSIAFCVLASVADAIMVILLYYVFAFAYKTPFWIQTLTIQRMVMLILVGAVGAILAEMRYTSEGDWAYADAMPLIPLVNAGLSPVLQFMLLPVLTYYTSFRILKKHIKTRFF